MQTMKPTREVEYRDPHGKRWLYALFGDGSTKRRALVLQDEDTGDWAPVEVAAGFWAQVPSRVQWIYRDEARGAYPTPDPRFSRARSDSELLAKVARARRLASRHTPRRA